MIMSCMMPVNNQDMTDQGKPTGETVLVTCPDQTRNDYMRIYMHGLVNILTVGERDKQNYLLEIIYIT